MVWKRQEPPKPSWPSPWGRGIPGWHLECYAMAEQLLGLPVDLHGGAPDLIYPHHYAENEEALALRGTPFSRVFLHTGFVLVAGAKMSKSTGNLISLRAALDDVGAGALRWYLLSTPYTQRLQWDPAALHRAAEEFALVRAAVKRTLTAAPAGHTAVVAVHRLAEGVRADLARGLATDRAFSRLRAWATRAPATATRRVTTADRIRLRRELRSIEHRTGLPLL